MTRENAIEILEELWRYEKTDKYTNNQIRKAIDIAIKALKQEPVDVLRGEIIDETIKGLLDNY